jgi:hypothetical protein
MFHGYTVSHVANILVHILAGITAIVCGTIAIIGAKGKKVHIGAGWIFIYAYAALVVTAVIGIVCFQFRSFLAVATVASSYDVFAGYRVLHLRGRRPKSIDITLSLIALLTPLAFALAIRRLHQPWSPALTWSVLGGLFLLATYDLLRIALPPLWLQSVWLQEHLYKMLAAYIAAAATGAATIFPRLAPWSALVPVMVGEMLTVCFLLKWRPSFAAQQRLSSPASVQPDETAGSPLL